MVYKTTRYLLLMAVCSFCLCFIALNDSVYATESFLAIALDTNSATLNIMPFSSEGSFVSSNNITIGASTTNYTGYKLSIMASNSTNLVNSVSNSNLTTISSAITENTFSTSSDYNNMWGYKPSKYYDITNGELVTNTGSNALYLPSPSTSTASIIDQTNSANSVANTYTVSIGARANINTPIGTYSNTFVITAIANAIPYTITYNANSGSDGPANEDSATYASTVNISSTIPTKTGYNFTGWCAGTSSASNITTTNDIDSCSTTIYNPNGDGTSLSIAIDQTSASNDTYLYAMWKTAALPSLYDTVASMSKGTQTAAELQATITVPTSSDPSQDTSNSGVYEYDASVFGTSSDASNDYKIYYYRGVLDSNLDGTNSTYGSNGDGAYYPNYVRLGDTCWRIVRTTGSGGVKMIYNGLYSRINSCAHATIHAQVTTQAFGLQGNSAQSTWNYNINRVGYTFNNSSDIQDITTATSVDTVFGSDANPSLNNARSNIKTYIEDTWYTSTNGISAYTSILEASAGYCNDRTAYSNTNTSTALTTIPPYRTSSFGQTMYFGAYGRNMDSAKTPSLTCPRSTVDLYHYVANSAGLSNGLKYPVALLTADEASFAGSGSSTATNGSASNYSSYLRSGNSFWLLSPYYRNSKGGASEFILGSPGLEYSSGGGESGVRPAISLKSGVTASGGSGTATDPWVVNPPPLYMQDMTNADCQVNVGTNGNATGIGDEITVYDKRDEKSYTVKQINGQCWMTQNLRYLGDAGSAAGTMTIGNNNSNVANKSITLYSLNSSNAGSFNAYSSHCDSSNGYNYACVYDSGNTSTGVWYNYYAASAGTISGSSNSTVASSDICPAGWHLPSGPNTTANTDYNKLVGNTTSGYQNTTAGLTAFSAVVGGRYYNGSLYYTDYGYWWPATASNTTYRYRLEYSSSDGQFSGNGNGSRYYGHFVRCVRSS